MIYSFLYFLMYITIIICIYSVIFISYGILVCYEERIGWIKKIKHITNHSKRKNSEEYDIRIIQQL